MTNQYNSLREAIVTVVRSLETSIEVHYQTMMSPRSSLTQVTEAMGCKAGLSDTRYRLMQILEDHPINLGETL